MGVVTTAEFQEGNKEWVDKYELKLILVVVGNNAII